MESHTLVPLETAPSPDALAVELQPHMLLCGHRGLEIYVTTAAESPTVMREIGRIRELEYRRVGAGRNVAADIDGYDTDDNGYAQLIAWDPEAREVVAMYRFIFGANALRHGGINRLRTATLFTFAPEFVDRILPHAVELGRSVVNGEANRAIVGLFAVWAGLGAFVAEFPDLKFFFGNVSVYRSWPTKAVDTLLAFLTAYYQDDKQLIVARPTVAYRAETISRYRETLFASVGATAGFERLLGELKRYDLAPPPILVSYLKATDRFTVFDTARDDDFGGAWETAISVSTTHLTQRTRRRVVESYKPVHRDALRRFYTEKL